MKRGMALTVVATLLCLLFAGCSQPQEEDPTLSIIKEQWTHYVIDRADPVSWVAIHPNLVSSFYPHTTEQEDIAALLDICATLDLNALQTEYDIQEENFISMTNVTLATGNDPDSVSLHIRIDPSGFAVIGVKIHDVEYKACVKNWTAYDNLQEFVHSLR